jgi:hypothetical protein
MQNLNVGELNSHHADDSSKHTHTHNMTQMTHLFYKVFHGHLVNALGRENDVGAS